MENSENLIEPFLFEHRDKYSKRYKWAKFIFILVGIFWTFTGLVEMFSEQTRVYHYILLIGGPLFIIQSIISEKNQRDRFIMFNSDQVEYKQNWRKATIIRWDAIKSVTVNNLEIVFDLGTAKPESIKLNEYNFNEVKEIKSQLRDFAEFKQIKISE